MAHIEIPVEFKFEAERATWRAGLARPVGWSGAIGGGLVVELVEPFPYEREHGVISEQQMEEEIPEILKRLRACVGKGHVLGQEIQRALGHHKIEVLVGASPNRREEAFYRAIGLGPIKLPTKREKIDAWKLRDEFLELKRSTADLVRFLNRWGNWSGEIQHGLREPDDVALVFANSIWADQDRFRKALVSEPSEWLSHSGLGKFEARPQFPHFAWRASTCREAIELTITFDLIAGSEFRLCALKDCRVPFKLESDHKRKFCKQYHAHLDSVRRNRRRSALAKRGIAPKKHTTPPEKGTK